jgi:chemotaxis protein MotB
MRAVNFMKVILKNDKLNPSMFSAKGFGEFKPVTSNNTAAGKAKNRRVEILITPRTIKQP